MGDGLTVMLMLRKSSDLFMVSQRSGVRSMSVSFLLHGMQCSTASDGGCRPLRHFAQMTAKCACVTAVAALARLIRLFS